MEDGNVKIVPFHQVFNHTWSVNVDGIGPLEAYANRDSMSYMKSFGLEHVDTMIRGTLRYPGWSETWGPIVRLGLPNETLRIPKLADRTYAEVVEMFLPLNVKGAPLNQRIAAFLQISPTGRIMENLRWLGLLSDERIGCRGDTAAAMLVHVLQTKLPLTPEMRDMVVLVHELDVEYPDSDSSSERILSTLVVQGEAGGGTAMARSVGLPVVIAVKLLLGGELSLTGCLIPTHPAIYAPVLQRIERAGLRFKESRTQIEDS
jgi:saccharopine dehydrogenase-like NADP-dependent oxidoreductase